MLRPPRGTIPGAEREAPRAGRAPARADFAATPLAAPPDPDFAREQGLNWFLRQVLRLLSFGIRRKAKRHRVSYSFLFMRSNGAQLSQIASLIEDGTIRPVVDRTFPFEELNDAFAYIDTGRAKGKVVVTLT